VQVLVVTAWGGVIDSARRPPPTRIWRGSASAENTVWWIAARKAGARGGQSPPVMRNKNGKSIEEVDPCRATP
jgi:hypothetical protein